MLAGVAGFEPTIATPKTAALPLGYTPTIVEVLYQLDLKKTKVYINVVFKRRVFCLKKNVTVHTNSRNSSISMDNYNHFSRNQTPKG
jgi:hypothetical protein